MPITVGRLRRGGAIKVTTQRARWDHDASLLSPPELAIKLNIPVNWLYVQIRKDRLLIDRQPTGAYLFPDTRRSIARTSAWARACITPGYAITLCPRNIDYRAPRGLDRKLLAALVKGDWIDAHDNLVITGPTGVDKSWLACALGHKACRDNRTVLYVRVPRLFDELALAHGDGSAGRRLGALGAAQLLILDDWGLESLGAQARHDLLEIFEDRYGRRSTVTTSQLPVAGWHAVIGQATYADAILGRLIHNAHRLDLSGESLRRSAPPSQA